MLYRSGALVFFWPKMIPYVPVRMLRSVDKTSKPVYEGRIKKSYSIDFKPTSLCGQVVRVSGSRCAHGVTGAFRLRSDPPGLVKATCELTVSF